MAWRHWCLVVAGLVVVSACSGGGAPASQNNRVTTPTDPLSVVRTTGNETMSSSPTSSAPNAIATEPKPYNATGRALFVSVAGNDANSGSWTSPLRTISKGVAAADPGDTIFVRGGTYSDPGDEALVMFRNKHGRADAWITLAATPGERPIVNASGWDPKYVLWRLVGVQQSSYIEIRGFELFGTAQVDQQPSSGIELVESHHVRVIDNRIHDVGGGGFAAIASNHYDVLNNVIWSTSFWNDYQTSAISSFQAKNVGGPDDSDGYSIRIRGNTVHSVENVTPPPSKGPITDGNCIIVDEHRQFSFAGSTLIDNNLCFNNGGRGVNVLRGDNVTIVNNTLYRNLNSAAMGDDGELSLIFAGTITLRNNLVVAKPGRAETVVHDSTVVFERNLYGRAGAEKRDQSDIATDAKVLMDPDKQDFRLVPGSVAIDAGATTDAPATDLAGRARTGAPDIGALEHAG